MTSKRWFARHALLPDGPARDVRFDVRDGLFVAVAPGVTADGAAELPGVVLPGFANGHSHAFHRALRGRTHTGGGTFWTWREQMYAVAARLDPDTYLALARATYAEMALSGVTSVGEFHYLHHGLQGRPYDDPNAMAEALRHAARQAGVRLTILDACYLAGGLDHTGHRPLDEVQRRFADRDVEAWASRAANLRCDETTRFGAAIHSVRAVPAAAIRHVVQGASGRPLHVHLSEQPAENEACRAYYAMTPTQLLDHHGALGTATTAVHATHLDVDDVKRLGATATTVCLCPTTERDLADGIGPARDLADTGARLSLGSDQHARTDLLAEARGLEMNERLRSGQRGRFTPAELLHALTRHDSIGWDAAGVLEAGARADLVAVRLDTVRTAGCDPQQVVYAACAADVDTVVVDGTTIVRRGEHLLGDVGRLLAESIDAVCR